MANIEDTLTNYRECCAVSLTWRCSAAPLLRRSSPPLSGPPIPRVDHLVRRGRLCARMSSRTIRQAEIYRGRWRLCVSWWIRRHILAGCQALPFGRVALQDHFTASWYAQGIELRHMLTRCSFRYSHWNTEAQGVGCTVSHEHCPDAGRHHSLRALRSRRRSSGCTRYVSHSLKFSLELLD